MRFFATYKCLLWLIVSTLFPTILYAEYALPLVTKVREVESNGEDIREFKKGMALIYTDVGVDLIDADGNMLAQSADFYNDRNWNIEPASNPSAYYFAIARSHLGKMLLLDSKFRRIGEHTIPSQFIEKGFSCSRGLHPLDGDKSAFIQIRQESDETQTLSVTVMGVNGKILQHNRRNGINLIDYSLFPSGVLAALQKNFDGTYFVELFREGEELDTYKKVRVRNVKSCKGLFKETILGGFYADCIKFNGKRTLLAYNSEGLFLGSLDLSIFQDDDIDISNSVPSGSVLLYNYSSKNKHLLISWSGRSSDPGIIKTFTFKNKHFFAKTLAENKIGVLVNQTFYVLDQNLRETTAPFALPFDQEHMWWWQQNPYNPNLIATRSHKIGIIDLAQKKTWISELRSTHQYPQVIWVDEKSFLLSSSFLNKEENEFSEVGLYKVMR